MESQPSLVTHVTNSFSSDTSDSYTRNNRRTSIAAFAKGIAKHAHDMKMFNPPERRWTGESKTSDGRRDSQDTKSVKRPERVLSFAPLPVVTPKESYGKLPKPSVVVEEPTTPVDQAAKPTIPPSAAKGSLRDRRKVNLDLSMPKEMPDLPARGRSPVDLTSSLGISAPRPRSPKTPWIRNEEPKWAPIPQMQKSTPIMEEEYIPGTTSALANDNHGGVGLLPGLDAIYASQSPKFERPPPKIRDRCYISRPRLTRNRSSRSGQSGTSDSTLAATPDGSWTTEDTVFQERQVATKAELQQLSQNTKASRSRRWLWKGKTDSEDASPSPAPQEPSRKFSFSLFKRSNRISDQTYPEAPNKYSAPPKSSAPTSSRPGRGKFQQPSTSLAHVHVPPTFIPPGVSRVPTPPMLDAQGEVKGKLADFFFDVHAGVGATPRRNKPKSSPGGYWDSDALLMSLDIDEPDDEEEEEGPGGPGNEFDVNGSPGLGPAAGGYLGVDPPPSPYLVATSPMLGHDGWFRVSHDPLLTPDDRTLNALARQEEEERRKFEWLIPEHLPNSPLCPLHEKYKGPSQGLCYWHGRRSGNKIRRGEYSRGTESGSGGGSGQSWGAVVRDQVMGSPAPRTPTREAKKRRLVSLSGP
jgi:hypothetical protein